MRAVPLLVLVPLLAGCLGAPAPGPGPAPPQGSAGAPLALAFDARGANLTLAQAAAAVPALAPQGAWPTFALSAVAPNGGEPNIGVTKSGAVFVTVFNAVWRSTDGGQTWKQVASYPTTEDPNLWVDPLTSRIFASQLEGVDLADCAGGQWSDDDGATWTTHPLMCGLPVEDHQKVATGPHAAQGGLPASPLYPDVVYFCYNKLASTDCAVSDDGGLTWPLDQPVAVEARDGCGGINGHEATARDGTVYVPLGHRSFTYAADTGKPLLCDAPYVALSKDDGQSWQVRKLPGTFGGPEGVDPAVTVSPDGTAYLMYEGKDHLQYLARSKDGFAHVDGPWQVSAPGLTSTVFTAITAGDDGRIAFAYLGTRDSREEPSKVDNATRWHLFLAESFDAEASDPTFVTWQVTPPDSPVQIGCVWLYGGSSDCRNLLDFIDLHVGPEGRPYVVFTGGCAQGCDANPQATAKDSRASVVTVARLQTGPSLFAAQGVLGPPGQGAGSSPGGFRDPSAAFQVTSRTR